MRVKCRVHIFSGSVRTRNKLYGVKCLVHLAARLFRQWMKERGVTDMRVRANEPNEPARLNRF